MSRPGVAPALAVTFGALGSLLPSWASVPIPLYDPVGRAWRFAVLGSPGGPPIEIGFYGIYLMALVGALVGAVLGRLLAKRDPSQAMLDAWAFTSLAVAAAYQLWTLRP